VIRTARLALTVASVVIFLTGVGSAQTVNCSSVAAWSGNSVPYSIGELVIYQGSEYKCIQSHTSQSDWTPTAAIDLWSLVGTCGASPTVVDPGVQSASRGTGATIISPTDDPNGFTAFFTDGFNRFQEIETVSVGANVGLGPRFNSNQCSSCHAQPAIGGSGAAVNPQFTFTTTSDGIVSGPVAAGNTMPTFITQNGPTREARFPFFFESNGTTVNTSAPNGGVEDLFTVAGRPDRGTCTSLAQPNFTAAENAGNVIFRIPTPVFGAGPGREPGRLNAAENRHTNLSNSFGISGSFNRSGNDGTITKFGWKAQNKSLHIFAGEAYNVEMGITNDCSDNEKPDSGRRDARHRAAGKLPEPYGNRISGRHVQPFEYAERSGSGRRVGLCQLHALPGSAANRFGGVEWRDGQRNQRSASGAAVFTSVGCATCHNSTPGTTQVSNFVPALSNQPSTRSLTLRFTTWVRAWRTTSRRAAPAATSSAPLHCGDWDNGSSSMHDGRDDSTDQRDH
jgi:mono/diheme cytochrome c family protein